MSQNLCKSNDIHKGRQILDFFNPPTHLVKTLIRQNISQGHIKLSFKVNQPTGARVKSLNRNCSLVLSLAIKILIFCSNLRADSLCTRLTRNCSCLAIKRKLGTLKIKLKTGKIKITSNLNHQIAVGRGEYPNPIFSNLNCQY